MPRIYNRAINAHVLEEGEDYGMYKLWHVLAYAGDKIYVVKCNVCGDIRRLEGRNIVNTTGKWCRACTKRDKKFGVSRAETFRPSPSDRTPLQVLTESTPWR